MIGIRKMRKKGAELSTSWTITIILLIIGFGILLFFLGKYLWGFIFGVQIDREICHEAVIFRATASGVSEAIEDYVPLKCKEAKFCITTKSGKEQCKEFENEPGVQNIKVKNKEQIERFLSQEIVECWKMMGEGKVSLFTQYFANNYGIGGVYPSCVICSRIAFNDEALKEKGIDLKKVDILNYMLTHKFPDKEISYWQYLVGEGGKFSLPDKIYDIDKDDKNNLIKTDKKISLDTVEKQEGNDELYRKELSVMFMQISAPGYWEVAGNTLKTSLFGGGTVAAAGVYVAGTKFLTLAGKAVLNWYTLAAAALFGIYQYGNVQYNKAVALGYCGDIGLAGEARSGCSVVRTVNYNIEQISEYCLAMESIP